MNHIGDTNKMVSDTPRTDEAQFGTGRVSVSFARQLERELTAANQRIKRLEEQLMDVKNEHAVLVADVVLRDDKIERIAHLEAALRRIASTDYRGNRSTESQIAAEALKP